MGFHYAQINEILALFSELSWTSFHTTKNFPSQAQAVKKRLAYHSLLY